MDIGAWCPAGTRFVEHRTGGGNIGLSRREITVGVESLEDQRIEFRVTVQTPPCVGRLCRARALQIHVHKWRLRTRWRLRCVVVGTDRASRDGDCAKQRTAKTARAVHGVALPGRGKSGSCDAGPIGAGFCATAIISAMAASNPNTQKVSMIP